MLKHYLVDHGGQQDALIITALDAVIPGFKAAGTVQSSNIEIASDLAIQRSKTELTIEGTEAVQKAIQITSDPAILSDDDLDPFKDLNLDS